jgi:hypothetical protein
MLSAIQLFRKRTESSDSPQLNRLPFAAFEGISENFNDFVERRQNGRDPVLLSLIFPVPAVQCEGCCGHQPPLAAIRALTSFFPSAVGNGLSVEKRIVPLFVSKPVSWSWNAFTMAELTG